MKLIMYDDTSLAAHVFVNRYKHTLNSLPVDIQNEITIVKLEFKIESYHFCILVTAA